MTDYVSIHCVCEGGHGGNSTRPPCPGHVDDDFLIATFVRSAQGWYVSSRYVRDGKTLDVELSHAPVTPTLADDQRMPTIAEWTWEGMWSQEQRTRVVLKCEWCRPNFQRTYGDKSKFDAMLDLLAANDVREVLITSLPAKV